VPQLGLSRRAWSLLGGSNRGRRRHVAPGGGRTIRQGRSPTLKALRSPRRGLGRGRSPGMGSPDKGWAAHISEQDAALARTCVSQTAAHRLAHCVHQSRDRAPRRVEAGRPDRVKMSRRDGKNAVPGSDRHMVHHAPSGLGPLAGSRHQLRIFAPATMDGPGRQAAPSRRRPSHYVTQSGRPRLPNPACLARQSARVRTVGELGKPPACRPRSLAIRSAASLCRIWRCSSTAARSSIRHENVMFA
jgi:hypothetical protein